MGVRMLCVQQGSQAVLTLLDLLLKGKFVFTGAETVNKTYGVSTALMFGDFLFAQTSFRLAQLGNIEVRAFSKLLPPWSYSGFAILLRWLWHHADLSARRSFD